MTVTPPPSNVDNQLWGLDPVKSFLQEGSGRWGPVWNLQHQNSSQLQCGVVKCRVKVAPSFGEECHTFVWTDHIMYGVLYFYQQLIDRHVHREARMDDRRSVTRGDALIWSGDLNFIKCWCTGLTFFQICLEPTTRKCWS